MAFHLPQFHPVEVNDREYGEGFTEWDLVKAARPRARGHAQPVVPGELGYYDLRDPAVRQAQAALASAHGIEGFAYWHYWSDGERQLERPVAEIVASGEPEFGFCLAWANHPWRKIGNPSGPEIWPQRYGTPGDDERHFAALEAAFHDPRYLTVEGRPIFYLFRPRDIPDLQQFCDRWRDLAVASGLPGLHIVGQLRPPWSEVEADGMSALDGVVPVNVFDASRRRLGRRLRERLFRRPATLEHRALLDGFPPPVPGPVEPYPCVVTNWDSTPRDGLAGLVLRDTTPELVAEFTRRAAASVADRPRDRRLVFLKSWNEWSEGNYLEPDARTGTALLRAVGDVLRMGV